MADAVVELKDSNLNTKKLETMQSLIDNVQTIADAHNILVDVVKHTEMDSVIEVVVDTESGVIDVDLSDFNFESVDDYALQVSFYGAKPLTASVVKVDEKTARVYLTDHTQWEFNDDRFYAGKDVTAVMTVSRLV